MRKKRLKKYITVTYLLLAHILYGQNNISQYQPSFYPKTPDAYALSKFVDIPSSGYTGVSSFSIPLYTINLNGVSFPISLQYHASGIKTFETASRVGLGWALDIGGISLSKQVNGLPDTKNPYKNPSYLNTPNGNGQTRIDWATMGMKMDLLQWICSSPPSGSGSVWDPEDPDPDIYSYSIMGNSGRFMYNPQLAYPNSPITGKRIFTFPYYDMDVSFTDILPQDNVSIWDNNNGYIYNFISNTKSYGSNSDADPYGYLNTFLNRTSWVIKDLVLPNKQKVTFNYDKKVTYKMLPSRAATQIITDPNNNPNGAICSSSTTYNNSITTINEDLITEIVFDEGIIKFVYENDIDPTSSRKDLPGDTNLRKVIVIDKNNNTIKSFTLNYDYFSSNEPQLDDFDISSFGLPYSALGDDIKDSEKFRLKLINVVDDKDNSKYSLEYYSNPEGIFPRRYTNAVDNWGVFNGNYNPTEHVVVENEDGIKDKIPNRKPDINYGVLGALKKIQYPTGGYSEIKYENDDYYCNCNVNEPINSDISDSLLVEGPGSEVVDERPIHFPDNLFETKVTFDTPFVVPAPQVGDEPRCRLVVKDGNTTLLDINSAQTKTVYWESNKNYSVKLSKLFDDSGANSGHGKCTAKFEWIKNNIVHYVNKQVGTLRVKNITNYSTPDSFIKRDFKYRKLTDSTISSGRYHADSLVYAERFAFPANIIIPCSSTGATVGGSCYSTQIKTDIGEYLNTVNGKSVGYGLVQELYTDNLKTYKTVREYTNDKDQEPFDPSQPHFRFPEYFRRGSILKETYFNDTNNILKEVNYNYTNVDIFNPTLPNDYGIAFRNESKLTSFSKTYISLGCVCTYAFSHKIALIKSAWIRLDSTTTKEYLPTGKLETSSEYNYTTESTRPTTILTTSSNGDVLKKELSYGSNGDVQSQKDYKNNILGKEFSINPDTVFPQNVTTKDILTNQDTTEITYDQYDNKGNLLQYTNKFGISTTVVWGYNNTQPIAKIEGATYPQVTMKTTDIPQSLIDAIVTASNTDASQAPGNDESALLAALDTFRKDQAMVNYQITTYTYDPLIGVRSITPPNGIRQVYIYDTANRLKEVRDISGNILKENKYNYKQ